MNPIVPQGKPRFSAAGQHLRKPALKGERGNAAMIKMKALKIAAGRKREGAVPSAQPLRCFLHLTEILHAYARKIS